MRSVAPVLCALLVLGGVAGCATSDATALPATAEAEIDAFEASLEELAGVDDAQLAPSATGTQVHLTVELDDEITPAEVEEIATSANALRTMSLPDGVYPGQIELHLGDSVYAHFSVANDEALRAQSGFWLQLARTGVEAVSMRTFTQPLGSEPGETSEAPTPSSTSAAPLLMNTPTGRYIGVTLPDDADDAAAAISALGSVNDPGAALGEWHVTSADARIRAEFSAPSLPSASDIGVATTLGSMLDEVEGDATLSLRFTQAAPGESHIDAEMTAFDERLEDADASTAEEELRETPIWPATVAMVETLVATGSDFEASLLSNTLHDVGSFVLEVSMTGCRFAGDEAWPALSADLSSSLMSPRGANAIQHCRAA